MKKSCVAISVFAALALSIAGNRLQRTIVTHVSLVVASEVRLAAPFLVLRRVSFEMGTQMTRPRNQAATEPALLGVVAGWRRFDIVAHRDECIDETLCIEGRLGYSRDHMGPSDKSGIAQERNSAEYELRRFQIKDGLKERLLGLGHDGCHLGRKK